MLAKKYPPFLNASGAQGMHGPHLQSSREEL